MQFPSISWFFKFPSNITYHLLREPETAIDSMMPRQMQRQLRRAGPRKTVASLSLMEGCHWLLFFLEGRTYTPMTQWLFNGGGGDDWRKRIKTADVLKHDFLRWGNELKNGWIRNSCDLFRFFTIKVENWVLHKMDNIEALHTHARNLKMFQTNAMQIWCFQPWGFYHHGKLRVSPQCHPPQKTRP